MKAAAIWRQCNLMQHLKILLLEDSPFDVTLIERELTKAGVSFTSVVVCERPAFEEALVAFNPDVILCDHHMPRMNSIEAFQIFREYQNTVGRLIPFILVTGEVSEDFAVQCIKAGVDDYILKDRLKRLPISITNGLEKCRIESERLRYFRQVVRDEAMMKEAEQLAQLGSWQGDLISGEHTWSDETYRIIGYEPGEIAPGFESFYSIVHPGDVNVLKRAYTHALESGLSERASEFRIIDKTGKLKYISGKIKIDRDENGHPIRISGFILDITDRKKTEIRLLKREQEYKSLLDQNPEAVFSLDITGRITNINDVVVRLVGLSAGEILNTDFRPLVHPDDRERVAHHFAGALDRKPQRFIARIIGAGGRIFTVDTTNMPIVVDNQVIGVHGVARDITEKKELEDLLDQAYRHARIGGWELNLRERKVSWTPVIREILEVSADADIDLDTAFLFYKEGNDRETVMRAVEKGIQHGASFDLIVRAVTARGNERWVRITGEGESSDGKCIRLRGTLQDVHERKVALETLNKTLHEKADILESIGDGFFAVDKEWTVTYWNNKAEMEMGISRADILGKNVWDVFGEGRSPAFYAHSKTAMEQQGPVHYQEFFPPSNSWFDVNVYPSDSGLSVYFKNITDKKIQRDENVFAPTTVNATMPKSEDQNPMR